MAKPKDVTINNSIYKIGSVYVPDEGATDSKIVFVGEAPGETEELERRPFVGAAGNLLTSVLGRNGISREEVRLANLCKFRPAYNKFENLDGSVELSSGLTELYDYLRTHKPVVIAALGNWPLYYLTGKGTGRAGISAWRGSILRCSIEGLEETKVIPTYHPSYILRDRKSYPIFDQDIKRIVHDSAFREFNYPQRKIIINPQGLEIEEWTQNLCEAEYLGVDIESVMKSTHILCISFSPSPNLSVVFPWTDYNLRFIQRILSSPAKKIFHFGLFDTEMLWLNGLEVENWVHDTLTMQHVLNPELPRGLDFLASIYTREPYYKSSGRGEIPKDQKAWSVKANRNDLYRYNGKDTAVTIECAFQMLQELHEEKLYQLYEYEMSLMEPCQWLGRAGLPIDLERRDLLKNSLLNKWAKLQSGLEALAGKEVNVKSPRLADLLYGDFKLPPKRNRNGGLTCDEDAIVALIGFVKGKIADLKTDRAKPEWNRKLAILVAILKIRGIRQLISNYLNTKLSTQEGTIRATYKPSATETGRFAAQRYVDTTGFNPQTLPRTDIEVTEEEMNERNKNMDVEFELEEERELDNEDLEQEMVA